MSAVLVVGLIAAASSAAPVTVTGDCPGADAVTVALRSALGGDAKPGTADVAKVSDLGNRFSVAAAGQVREFADPGRDCEERARAAAVFIALALNPPLLPTPPPPPAPAVVTAPPAAAPPESTSWLDLAVGARFDGGAQSETTFAGGVEIRATAGRRWLGLAATAGILAPSDTQFSSVTVREQRFPLSLAVTARRRVSPRVAVGAAAGAALVPITLRAPDLDSVQPATRLDVGARLAFEVQLRATARLAPFVGVHAEIFPRAYELEVDPLGKVGSTGRFWLGASAGLSFEAMPSPSRPREPNQVSASL
jgi:hypothetical protein